MTAGPEQGISYTEALQLLSDIDGYIAETQRTHRFLLENLENIHQFMGDEAYERGLQDFTLHGNANTQCLFQAAGELRRAPGMLLVAHAVSDERAFLRGIGLEVSTGEYQAVIATPENEKSYWPLVSGDQLALIGGTYSVFSHLIRPHTLGLKPRSLRAGNSSLLSYITPYLFA